MIYLDYAATTPIDEAVFDAMLPYLKPDGLHGNPASTHGPGLQGAGGGGDGAGSRLPR